MILLTAAILWCSPANTTVIPKTSPVAAKAATFKQRWLAIYFRDRAK